MAEEINFRASREDDTEVYPDLGSSSGIRSTATREMWLSPCSPTTLASCYRASLWGLCLHFSCLSSHHPRCQAWVPAWSLSPVLHTLSGEKSWWRAKGRLVLSWEKPREQVGKQREREESIGQREGGVPPLAPGAGEKKAKVRQQWKSKGGER